MQQNENQCDAIGLFSAFMLRGDSLIHSSIALRWYRKAKMGDDKKITLANTAFKKILNKSLSRARIKKQLE